MATTPIETYLFENNRFAPFTNSASDSLAFAEMLRLQGYAQEEQVWGNYPDAYIKVYEAAPHSPTAFKYVAVLTLVRFPSHVFIRDLNGLIQLLHMLLPLFSHHSRPEQDTGDALFGSQGADTEPESDRNPLSA